MLSILFIDFINFADNEQEKYSVLPPASSVGSLSSITTTSIASSEDPRGGDDGDRKDFVDDKLAVKTGLGLKQEEWWKTTLQVSIPFLIAGIGTIGAGVILGRVEVRHQFFIDKSINSIDIYKQIIIKLYKSFEWFIRFYLYRVNI